MQKNILKKNTIRSTAVNVKPQNLKFQSPVCCSLHLNPTYHSRLLYWENHCHFFRTDTNCKCCKARQFPYKSRFLCIGSTQFGPDNFHSITETADNQNKKKNNLPGFVMRDSNLRPRLSTRAAELAIFPGQRPILFDPVVGRSGVVEKLE